MRSMSVMSFVSDVDAKVPYFFYADKFVGHSFIQIRKSCFFFPKPRKKKTRCVFFFPRKSSSAIHSDFDEVLFFFNKSGLFFFVAYFACFFVFFFSRTSSHVIHSFNFGGRKKKHNPEKKTAFSFIQSKSVKNAQKRTYPGNKKNTVPLRE